jgi:hypothetical protein
VERYNEGEMSGAAVMLQWQSDPNREMSIGSLIGQAQQAYRTNGPVFACILARIMLLSQARFTFQNLVTKQLHGTEDLRILEYPWDNATTAELVARMEQDRSQAGNAYIWKADDTTLVRLPPEQVTIVSHEVEAPGGGRYRRVLGYDWDPTPTSVGASSTAQFLLVDEVAHWSYIPDPAANFRGMSWLTPILQEVSADSGMTAYKTMYLDHGQPVTAVKYAAKLQPASIDAAVSRIMGKYGGVSNAWKPLIVDQGADPIMGAPLKDLDFRAVQAGGEQRICSNAGVPATIIGLRSSEQNETWETAVRRFADLFGRSSWASLAATLQKLVPNVPAKGVRLWYDTTDIAALQAAETERAQVTQVNAAATLTLIQAGMTRESVIATVSSGDWSQLVPDPNAPTPGVVERETITAPVPFDTAGQPDPGATTVATSSGTRPPRVGTPPGGPQALLTKAQTPASKKPMPASFPTPATNGKGP